MLFLSFLSLILLLFYLFFCLDSSCRHYSIWKQVIMTFFSFSDTKTNNTLSQHCAVNRDVVMMFQNIMSFHVLDEQLQCSAREGWTTTVLGSTVCNHNTELIFIIQSLCCLDQRQIFDRQHACVNECRWYQPIAAQYLQYPSVQYYFNTAAYKNLYREQRQN